MQQRPIDTAGQAAPPEPPAPRPAKLRCEGIWKVFGQRAERILREHGFDPTPERLAEAGLTAAGLFAVVDEAGQLVGSLDREAVIRVLAGELPGGGQ